MNAVQLLSHGNPGAYRFHNIPDPVPGANEVLVSVRACGLNHLDLWTEQASLPVPVTLPRILGCEIAGVVAQPGALATRFRPGDRVAVQSNLFCGSCEYCSRGEESLCLNGQLLGVQRDGGFAELVAVPEQALVRLPDHVPFETAAALTLAGSTAMHMLENRTTVRPDEWVLVMGGASGVGSVAIQIARNLGARVLSTGSTPQKRELALRLGAEQAFDPADPAWIAQIRQATGKRGVDLIVEHVGGPILEQLFACLARGGRIVTCGATAGRHTQLDLWPFFVKQQSLIGSYGRTRYDIEKTIAWAAEDRIEPVIDSLYPLPDTPAALARLRSGLMLGKILVRI